MKLIRQIITKKFELYDEFKLLQFDIRAIWNFYCTYSIALVILGVNIDNRERLSKQMIWERVCKDSSFNKKPFQMMTEHIQKDTEMVLKALGVLEDTQNIESEKGDIYEEGMGMIGVYSWDFN